MHFPRFQLFSPATIEDALSLMSTYGDTLKVLAGGTELAGRMKQRLVSPPYVLTLKRIKGITGIERKREGLVLGATTTLTEIAASQLVKDLFPVVSAAAGEVAAPAIRNVGTIGGNLLQENRCLFYNQSELPRKGLGTCLKLGGKECNAVRGMKRCASVYQGDLAPVLIAVGAKALLKRAGSRRSVPVRELFTGEGKRPLNIAPDELLTEILLPVSSGTSAAAYKRLGLRGSIDYPLASAAVFLAVGANDVVADARVVLGAAGAGPKIVKQASDLITGRRAQDVDESVAQKAASFASKEMEAVDNVILPPTYRRSLAAALARRALDEALRKVREVHHAG